jgi:hypothetical protein
MGPEQKIRIRYIYFILAIKALKKINFLIKKSIGYIAAAPFTFFGFFFIRKLFKK